MIQNTGQVFTFYHYPAKTSEEGIRITTTHTPFENKISETDLEPQEVVKWFKPIVYFPPDQIALLPSSVKANHAFLNFLSACRYLIPKEHLPQGLSKVTLDNHFEDPVQAMTYLEQAAAAKYAPAQNILGLCFLQGHGVKLDMAKGIQLLEAASAQNFVIAQNNLGVSHEKGWGLPRDITKAAILFKKAADKGYTPAQVSLANYFFTHTKVEDNAKLAVEYYEKAAKNNHPVAMTQLALCSLKGFGTPTNIVKGITLLQKAAGMGFSQAQFQLGSYYIEKNTNLQKGIELLQKATDHGNLEALVQLASCYQNAIGVSQDLIMAAHLLQQGADRGSVTALAALASCYQNGRGVQIDLGIAATLLHRAAELGHAPAQHALGVCYLIGYGVGQNREHAKFFLAAAAEQNFEPSLKSLAILDNENNFETSVPAPLFTVTVEAERSQDTKEDAHPAKRQRIRRKKT